MEKAIRKILPWVVLIGIPVVLMLPLMMTHQLHYRVDTWFHMMRIQEMNEYWKNLSIPSLGNIYSFGQSGQLIQGMYPSLTLFILVGMTSFLSAINQIYAIYYLCIMGVGVAYYFIFKKTTDNSWIAVIKALVLATPTTYIFVLQSGQIGLALACGFLPFVFWGLYKIREPKDKTADKYIGIGVGLILLSHVASGICVIIMVTLVALIDLVIGNLNFKKYFKAGVLAFLIGFPTIVKMGLFGSSIMGVAVRETEAKMSVLTIFSSLWSNGGAYFGISAFMLIGLIYVILTSHQQTEAKSMKIAVIMLALMSTSTGYLLIFTPLQFPQRFLTYALLMAMFIFLLEFPRVYNNIGDSNVKIIYMLLVCLALVPALNAVLSSRIFVQDKPLWQDEKKYLPDHTKIDKETFEFEKFTDTRTYIDYLPKQQLKTALKAPIMSAASKQMKDVNEAKSVRPTSFKHSDIKTVKHDDSHTNIFNAEVVIPYQPAKNITAEKRTLSMDVTVDNANQYDLPFWMYPHVKYTVTVNGQKVTPHASKQGRMSVPLAKGTQTVKITQGLPIMVFGAYLISILTLIGSIVFIARNGSVRRKNK